MWHKGHIFLTCICANTVVTKPKELHTYRKPCIEPDWTADHTQMKKILWGENIAGWNVTWKDNSVLTKWVGSLLWLWLRACGVWGSSLQWFYLHIFFSCKKKTKFTILLPCYNYMIAMLIQSKENSSISWYPTSQSSVNSIAWQRLSFEYSMKIPNSE